MINIIKKEELNKIITEESIIITPSSDEYYYKNKYYGKNYKIYNLRNYVLKNYNKSKKLISNEEAFVIMYRAFLSVKKKLLKYNNVNNFEFINSLLDTYDYFYELSFIYNDKFHDLKMIYESYDNMLNDLGLINYQMLIKYVTENTTFKGTYVFLGLDNMNDLEIELIKKIGNSNNVFIYCKRYNEVILNKIGIDLKDVCLPSKRGHDFYALNDTEEEVKFVLNDISKKVLNGASYQDFLIVVPKISDCEPYFNLIFNVPYSKKVTSGILSARFIKFLSFIFNGDFSCKNFLNLLKLNLFNISKEVIDKIDDYVYEWNLENESFYLPFTKADSLNLNEAKYDVINQIKYLLENIINETKVSVIAKCFWTYLQEEKIDEKLFNLDEEGYLLLVSSLEYMCDYLDDIKPEDFFNLLASLVVEKQKINHMTDEVKVCQIDSACYLGKKYVYLMGASEDDLPGKFKLGSLISKDDVKEESLVKKISDFSSIATFNYLKLIDNKNVIITYHKLSLQLKLLTPSNLVKEPLKREEEVFYNKKLIAGDYALKLSNNEVYMQDEKDEMIQKVNLSSARNMNLKINKQSALKLYTNNLNLSPSSIETYAKCPFYFFCGHGIKLNVKEKNMFDNREIGSLVHYVLEKIITNDYNMVCLSNLSQMVNRYALDYLNKNNKIINNTINYLIKELSLNVTMIVKKILKEKDFIKFKPKYTEFKISDDATIKPVVINLDNATLKLSGIVDRIDTYEDVDNVYYAVIDYKTGGKKLRLDDCLEALNLQMLLYLLAIKQSVPNATLSAVLYYPALLKEKSESRKLNEEELNASVQKRLLMDGMINQDQKVIDAFSKDYIGDFINVTLKGKIDEEKLFTISELNALFSYIKIKLTSIGNEILSGNINVSPVSGRVNACEFCKFNSICAFDKEIDKSRRLKNYKNKEVFEMIEGDLNA